MALRRWFQRIGFPRLSLGLMITSDGPLCIGARLDLTAKNFAANPFRAWPLPPLHNGRWGSGD
jgi:hypothetical protein